MAYSEGKIKTTNVNYLNKDFNTFKNALVEYAKAYFPNSYKDFNETSPGMMLIEMSAYVGDVLSFYIDQQYKEMFLPLAQERKNMINLAKTMGYKVKPITPAYTTLKVTQEVSIDTSDVNNIKPDYSDAVVIDKGLQVSTDVNPNLIFETLDIIDFTVSGAFDPAPYESNFNDDGLVTNFTLTRNVNAISGETKSKTFTVGSPQKFLRFTLPEKNVIDIVSVTDQNSGDVWYEVDYLAQDKVPIDTHYTADGLRNTAYSDTGNQNTIDIAVPYTVQYLRTSKRFITEINEDDTTSLVFGNGVMRNGHISNMQDFYDSNNAGFTIQGTQLTGSLGLTLDPLAADQRGTLGETPNNTTLVVKYRVGGGVDSNVSSNELTTINNKTDLTGNSDAVNLLITNEKPAYGGGDAESVEEIRRKAKAFFATQNRCVTKEDYEARLMNMPPKYGGLAKVFAVRSAIDEQSSLTAQMMQNFDYNEDSALTMADFTKLNNAVTEAVEGASGVMPSGLITSMSMIEKFYDDYQFITTNLGSERLATIDVFVLSYDENKSLVTLPSGSVGSVIHPLKANIKSYISNYKMISDQVHVTDGKIINFGVAFEVVAHRSVNKADVKLQCINKITEYFDIDKMQFHQPIYTGDLEYELMGIDGVRNVNWVELTQDFTVLSNNRSLPGIDTGLSVLWDYNINYPNGDSPEGSGVKRWGWQYDFAQFYEGDGTNFVAPGVVLPSVEPAVFELKYPKQNIRGVVL